MLVPSCNTTSFFNGQQCTPCTVCPPGTVEQSPCYATGDRTCKGMCSSILSQYLFRSIRATCHRPMYPSTVVGEASLGSIVSSLLAQMSSARLESDAAVADLALIYKVMLPACTAYGLFHCVSLLHLRAERPTPPTLPYSAHDCGFRRTQPSCAFTTHLCSCFPRWPHVTLTANAQTNIFRCYSAVRCVQCPCWARLAITPRVVDTSGH